VYACLLPDLAPGPPPAPHYRVLSWQQYAPHLPKGGGKTAKLDLLSRAVVAIAADDGVAANLNTETPQIVIPDVITLTIWFQAIDALF
jgi:hypothetical protein